MMTPRRGSAQQAVSYSDKSPDKAYRFLESFCGVHAFRVSAPDSFHFTYQGSITEEGSASFGHLQYKSPVFVNLNNEYENYSLSLPLAGGLNVFSGDRKSHFSDGRAFILSPGQEISIEVNERSRFLLVTIHRRTIELELRRLLGRVNGRLPVFSLDMTGIGGLSASWWRSVRGYLRERAQHDSIVALPGVGAELERGLVRSLLLMQDSSMKEEITHAVSAVLPPSVERAKAFVEQNYAEPLSLDHLQRAAGLNASRLGIQFREHLGHSPMGYLKKVRLERARELLMSQSAGRKISTVVLDVGFNHFGRFSIEYKAAFGESPKETVARASTQHRAR
jgi:AraC-like DNA-binding protein